MPATTIESTAATRPSRSSGRQLALFGVLVGGLALAAFAIGWLAWTAWQAQLPGATPDALLPSIVATEPPATRDPLEPLSIAAIQRGPHLVFQNVIRDDHYAALSLIPLDSPAGMRLSTELICERVHFAAGHGLCLAAEHGATSSYYATLFGSDFVETARIQLGGAPSFARISPDGRLAAASVQTSPVTEDEPLAPTQTWLIDTSSGQVLADLEDFSVIRNGLELDDAEMDLWGVTFKPDGDGFFASLRTGGNLYLVEGSIDERRLTVGLSRVSAPSLSPDGTRIAFAKLISSIGPTWRFHVLDLQTMADLELPETKSIDDQMEWLDNDRLLYGLGADIWSVASDGSGLPAPFLFGGLSPAVVRPS